MIKRVLLGLVVLLALIVVFIFVKTRPSGDINAYAQYQVDDTGVPADQQVKVTFFGVSTLLFDDGETQILTDGFFSRPSLATALFSEIESDTVLIDQIVSTGSIMLFRGNQTR